MFERRHEPLATMPTFIYRMFLTILAGCALICSALAVGVLGYHDFAKLSWIDSFLNASMILSSMGPVDVMPDNAAKIFAGLYALFSGLIFIMSIGLLFTPVVHRLFHQFHLSGEEEQ